MDRRRDCLTLDRVSTRRPAPRGTGLRWLRRNRSAADGQTDLTYLTVKLADIMPHPKSAQKALMLFLPDERSGLKLVVAVVPAVGVDSLLVSPIRG